MLQERSVDVGTITLNYAVGPPNGPPLVMVHGAGSRWQNLLPLLSPLAASWHVYAPDLRGHGGSLHQPGGYRLDDFVMDTLAFLGAVVGAPAVLLGYSLGGFITLSLAARHPDRVRALVIAETPLYAELHPQAGPFNAALAALAERGDTVSATEEALAALPVGEHDGTAVRLGDIMAAPLLHDWAVSLVRVDPEVLRGLADGRLLAGYDAETLLPQVRCPTLLIQADPALGGNMTDRDVQRASTQLRDAAHVRLVGLGHGLHQEDPDAALEPFVAWAATLR
jgi:pimeloyl-ACP methyl ester carboxylesterase